MAKIRKYANGIERFLRSEKGQWFFNFAYSIGAAIVIWGALFKILHLPGGNLLLCIGMGTEVAMFILTAFDRPPKEYHWEEVFPELDSRNGGVVNGGAERVITRVSAGDAVGTGKSVSEGSARSTGSYSVAAAPGAAAASYSEVETGVSVPLNVPSDRLNDLSERIASLEENTAEGMESLNRNISGLNSMYELQLKSIAGQLDSIERVNRGLKEIRDIYEKSAGGSERYCEETEKLVENMRRLNSIYENVISAMSANFGGMGTPRNDSGARRENRED